MRGTYQNEIYILGVMYALALLAGCSENVPTKIRHRSSSKEAPVNVAQDLTSEISADSFSPPPTSYPWTCTQPNLPANSGSSRPANQAQWRNEADQIKNRFFLEIHQEGLTQDGAVELALINNPSLLAYYENLEVAYADLLEAGFRENPVLKKSKRFPDEEGLEVNKEFEVTINFLDFFLIPFRQNAALAELQVIESEFGQMVLDLSKEVKLNWLMVKLLELELLQETQRVELKNLAAELAELQRREGNVNDLAARNYKLEQEMAVGKLKTLSAELESAREKLNRSLGLFGPDICFPIAGVIDWKSDFALPAIVDMEQAAIENRLDLEAIRREIHALAEKAKLKDPWTYGNLAVGQSTEREPDGLTISGPVIELEVPIFNSGQAARQKYHALIEQAQNKLVAKAVEACSEVREFLKTTNIYQSYLENLEQKVLPDFKTQLSDAQAHYNVMAIGVFDLFELKESEIDAIIDHIHALKHYMTAKIELLHALGGHFAAIGGKR